MDLAEAGAARPGRAARIVLAVACGTVAAVVGWALASGGAGRGRLAADVRAALPRSGVEHPVTAVLLNFRAFDTMLELAVLLVVAIATGAVGGIAHSGARPEDLRPASPSPLMDSLVHDLVPFALLAGAYLLWVGAYAPGGAFQAGAVIAAAGVLAHFSPRFRPQVPDRWPTRAVLALGAGAFACAALVALAWTGVYLGYPPAQAGWWILAIEAAATLSVAAVLYVTFRAVMSADPSRRGTQ